VSHEDVLPYIPSEPKPINHQLFDRFFTPSYGKGKVCSARAGKKNFLSGSTTWRQKFPADQQSIFVLNLHVHKHTVF
jgi:hypothetical protein